MKNTSVNKYIYIYIEDYITVNQISSQIKNEGSFPTLPIPLLKNAIYTNGSYFQFNNVRLRSEEDFTFDFWFYTNDNSWSRIFDWYRKAEDTYYMFATNMQHSLFSSTKTDFLYNRGQWNHYALSYDSMNKVAKIFLNGNLRLQYGAIPSYNPIACMGKSSWANPNINAYYTGIRIINKCLFTKNFNYIDIGDLKYHESFSSKIFNTLNSVDENEIEEP